MGSFVAPVSNKEVERKVGFIVLAIYLFLIFSRLQEYLAMFLGTGFFLSLIFGSVGLVVAIAGGTLVRGITSRQGVYLLALTAWLLIATAASTWKGGSVALLTGFWFKSLVTFLVTAGLVTTLDMSKKAMYVVAAGCLLAEIATALLGDSVHGRFELSTGSLGNANGLAFHVVLALPFLYLLLMEGKQTGKIVGAIGIVYGMVVVIKTGSRSGLIQLCILLLLVFIRLSMTQKFVIGGLAVSVVVFGLTSIPQDTLDRYRTLLSDNSRSGAYDSAMESQMSRWALLTRSLQMSRDHPLLGVGPGVFASAAADEEILRGQTAAWRQTHNAYTQLSAEAGIPALLLYLLALGSCLKSTISLYRYARRRREFRLIANMSYCLTLSLIAFTLNGTTDSNAYQYYFPFLAGLTFSFSVAAKRLLETPAPAFSSRQPLMRSSMVPSLPTKPIVSTPVVQPAPRIAVRAPGGSRAQRNFNLPRV